MSEFFNLNNNSFDISKLSEIRKEDIEKLGDKKLFAIFNAINLNGDDVVDTSEISLFMDKLKEFDKDTDGNISDKEFKQFFNASKDMFGENKIKADSVAEIFNISISGYKAPEIQIPEFLFDFEQNARTDDDIKNSTIDFIFDEFNNGMATIEGFDEGIISKGYNSIKEFLNSKMAKSNVMRILYMKNETAELLRKAQDGELTFSEYYKTQKENLMAIFPGAKNYTDEQKTKLRAYIDGVNERVLIFLIKEALKVPNPDSPDYNAKRQEFAQLFETVAVQKDTTTISTKGDFTSFSSKTEYKPHSAYSPENGERLMTFEEVFKNSYGLEYDIKNFERLENAKTEYLMAVSVYAKADKIHELLDRQISINKGNNSYGANSAQEKQSMKALESAMFAALRELGANTPEEQLNLLKDMSGYSDIKLKDFKENKVSYLNDLIIETGSNFPINSYMLVDIAQKLLDKVDENKNSNPLNTPENTARNLEVWYGHTFGREDVDSLVQAYINDQESSVQSLRTGVEIAGGAAAVIGMFVCPPLALAGAAVGAVGGVGVEALNEATKKEFTQERKEELLKELATNVTLFAAGGAAGRAGMAAKAALIAKNCPRLVACIADIGLDSTLSLISTYALTGQISLEGEGFSQALSLIAGHIKAGRFGKRALSRQDINPRKNPAFNHAADDLAKNNPKLYQDFQLLRSKNLLPHSGLVDIQYNPKSSTFSKQFLEDVATMARAVRSGIKPVDAFVPKFKSIAEASANRKVGETFSIEGTNDVYYVSSKGAQKLDMDRDMYFNLFPPLKSAVTQQGQMGDCYFVSGVLDACMSNPEAKAMLLSKIHQRGNDITIDLGSYEVSTPEIAAAKLPYSITFKGAKKNSSLYHNEGVSGAQGLKLVEQVYGYKLVAEDFAYKIYNKHYGKPEKQAKLIEELGELFINPKAKPSKELAEAMEYCYGNGSLSGADFWGRIALNVDGIEALRYQKIGHGGNSTSSFKNFFDLAPIASKYVRLDDIGHYLDDPNIIMHASTEVPDSELTEQLKLMFSIGYVGRNQLAGQHAYRVADVDNINNTVSVVNPWDTSKIVTIPRSKFEELFGSRIEILDITKTNEAVQSPFLVSLLKGFDLKNVSPQGRYYSNEEMLNTYFREKKANNGFSYPERIALSCDDEEFFVYLKENPHVKAAVEKFKDWGCPPYIQMIVGSMGNNVDVEAVTKALIKAADNQDVIGKDVLNLVLCSSKSQDDFIFTLDKAPDIVPKLRARGFDAIQIFQTLSNLSKETYPYIKELWE